MASDATIVEVPRPPAGRLPFLRLLARVVSNPVGSWGEDFYDEPMVVYDDFGPQTVFVMDPELVQQILLDDSDAFTKSPLYDDVLGRAGGKGLLIAEGDDWRRQRRIAAPLFRAEAILSYAPAFAASCEPVLARWRKAAPGSLQIIGKDMTVAAMQALQDTILGADLREHDRKTVSEAGTAFRTAAWLSLSFRSQGRLASHPCLRGELEGELILDVERLGAGRLVVGVERDLLNLGLGFAQQRIAMGLQRLAPLVDEDRGLELHVALLQAIDDGFELLERLLEAHVLDVVVF